MRWIGDCDPPDALLRQGSQTEGIEIEPGRRSHPDGQAAFRIREEAVGARDTRRPKLPCVVDISREEQIKRRAVHELRMETAGGTVGDRHLGVRMHSLKCDHDLVQRIAEV
jgi:hypothetical protein